MPYSLACCLFYLVTILHHLAFIQLLTCTKQNNSWLQLQSNLPQMNNHSNNLYEKAKS